MGNPVLCAADWAGLQQMVSFTLESAGYLLELGQDQASCAVDGMPEEAARLGAVA